VLAHLSASEIGVRAHFLPTCPWSFAGNRHDFEPVADSGPGISVRVCVGLRSWRRRCAASRPDSYLPAGGPSRPAHLPAAVPSYRPRCG
jgi:hypothetical protein